MFQLQICSRSPKRIKKRFNLFRCIKRKTYLNHWNIETNWTQRISKKQGLNWTFLSIFSKRNILLHFKTITFFCDFILKFLKEHKTFESTSVYIFPSYSQQPTNSYFVSLKEISDWNLEKILHPLMNYWFKYCDLC